MLKKPTDLKLTTRSLIIKEATQLFYTHGVHWVSFQQIAEKVEISQPAIYKHFSDKDDLLVACILNTVEVGRLFIDKHVSNQKSPHKKLFSYLEANLIWVEKDRPQASMLLAIYYFSHLNLHLKKILDHIHIQSLMRIKDRLNELNEQKKINTKEIESLANILHNQLIGEMLKLFLHPENYSLNERINDLKNSCLLLLKAF